MAVEAIDRKSILPIDWKSQPMEETLKAVESYRAAEKCKAEENHEAAEKSKAVETNAVETNDQTRCELEVGRKGEPPCRTSYQVRNKPSRASSMMALSMLAAAAAAAISTPSMLRGKYLLGILTTNRRRASAQNAPSQAVSHRRHLARSHAGEVPVGFPSTVASGGASNLRRE
jgi:anti-sigma factor RsiW